MDTDDIFLPCRFEKQLNVFKRINDIEIFLKDREIDQRSLKKNSSNLKENILKNLKKYFLIKSILLHPSIMVKVI